MDISNTTYNETSVAVEVFSVGFCHLIDFTPNMNGTDCSITKPTHCIRCPVMGTYFTGESVNDNGSIALKYYYAISILILVVSILGFINNVFILMVKKRRKNLNSFDIFLIVLAGFDAFSSLLTISALTSCAAYFGNWFGRGRITMYWYSLSLFSAVFGRSGSTFTTVFITIERFFMIMFPFKANSWFTVRNTQILSLTVLGIACLLNFPRFFGYSVTYNEYQDILSIQGMEWVLKATVIGKFAYRKLDALHNRLDFWMPLPIIVLFNLLSLWKVHQITTKRREINVNIKREIQAIKMFLPVVFVYFLTNIGPIVNYVLISYTRRAYREMYQVLFLSIALNSVANLPIYYWSSSVFKAEFHEAVGNYWSPKLNKLLKSSDNGNKTTVNSSILSASDKY